MHQRVNMERLFAGDPLAIARAISAVENDTPESQELLHDVFPRTGRCYRIGVTGPPGAGKSTITNKLALHYSKRGLSVGILAVDPTSPFTGGALLGDRVRMTDVELDRRVFIRSMASRGSLGGLSKRALDAADILDAAGKDVVIFETVGVGQSELDIAGTADTTIVVLVPESGDSIQAMKAGLMEIADLFVLNKADRAGADQAAMSIEMILHFRKGGIWNPPVLKTIASEGTGVDAVVENVEKHHAMLETAGILVERRKKRLDRRVRELVAEHIRSEFWSPERLAQLEEGLHQVMDHHCTPFDLSRHLLGDIK